MTFTDDDLRRLKELPDNVVITFKDGPSIKLKALLARLEAAEKGLEIFSALFNKLIKEGELGQNQLAYIDECDAIISEWRKVAGRK